MRVLKDLKGFLEAEIEILKDELAENRSEKLSIELEALEAVFSFVSEYSKTLE